MTSQMTSKNKLRIVDTFHLELQGVRVVGLGVRHAPALNPKLCSVGA